MTWEVGEIAMVRAYYKGELMRTIRVRVDHVGVPIVVVSFILSAEEKESLKAMSGSANAGQQLFHSETGSQILPVRLVEFKLVKL